MDENIMKKIKFPVLKVKMVESNRVISNDYNPNKVASKELSLLKHSISEDGVTQPIVTYFDSEINKYIVVDGFHRFIVLTREFKCEKIPIVVINKNIKDRMASTIRHNRARGKHQIDLMGDMVEKLLTLGWKEKQIAKHLGMEAEEVLRLKLLQGIGSHYKNQPFGKAWVRDENDILIKSK
jgi:ParB-like chromosome segregation protein Spo0J